MALAIGETVRLKGTSHTGTVLGFNGKYWIVRWGWGEDQREESLLEPSQEPLPSNLAGQKINPSGYGVNIPPPPSRVVSTPTGIADPLPDLPPLKKPVTLNDFEAMELPHTEYFGVTSAFDSAEEIESFNNTDIQELLEYIINYIGV